MVRETGGKSEISCVQGARRGQFIRKNIVDNEEAKKISTVKTTKSLLLGNIMRMIKLPKAIIQPGQLHKSNPFNHGLLSTK